MLPVRVPFEKSEYDASCVQYEEATDRKLRNTDTIILGGYGVQVKVQHKALVMCYDRVNSEEKTVTLYRGTNKVRQVIICSDGGYISLDAIKWCVDENITIYLLDWRGSLVQVLTPKHPSSAKLISQQYMASQSDLCFSISIELVRRKIQAQIETLTRYSHLPKLRYSHIPIQPNAMDTLVCGLQDLCEITSIDTLRIMEGSLSHAYFSFFVGMPIKWQKSATKIIPPHWLTITPRSSPLSKAHGARWSINPFHSALNFAYALLEGQVLRSIMMSGLEPTCGYLHAFQGDRTVLALCHDLMEPFRAVVDAKVLAFFEKTTFKKGDFIQVFSGEVRLNEELRRYILASCRVQNTDIDELVHWLKATLEKI